MRVFESLRVRLRHGVVTALVLTCIAVLPSTTAGCVDPQGPANPGIPDEICQRQHDCDASSDIAACMTRCRASLSFRVVYESAD